MERKAKEVSWFVGSVLAITESDIKRLTWLMTGLLILAEFFLREFKIIAYGYNFPHAVDLLVVIALAVFYLFFCWVLQDLYLDDMLDIIDEAQDLHDDEERADKDVVEEVERVLASEETVKITNNMQGVEDLVLQMYLETEEELSVVVASLTKILATTMLTIGTQEADITFSDMEVTVTVKDLSTESKSCAGVDHA